MHLANICMIHQSGEQKDPLSYTSKEEMFQSILCRQIEGACQQCHHERWMLEVIHSDFGYINFPTIILEYRRACDSSDTVHATIEPHEGYKSPGQEHKK